jgi:AsmA protein
VTRLNWEVALKRSTKILGAVAILVVVGLALIPLLVNAGKIRPAVEKQLTVALGRSVELGDLNLSVLSRSLVARDLRIADDPAFSTSAFLTAKELRIGAALIPLIFSHQVKLQSLEVESPQINLIRSSSGSWNFSSIGHATAASNAKRPSASFPSLPVFSVGRITVKDGRVLIGALPAHGEPGVYDQVNFTAHDFSFASQFRFEFSANLPAGGAINATGHLGPINRNDVAAGPGDAHVIVKNFAPVAAAFLHPDAGLSFLADLELHTASDGQTLTTNGTIRLQHLKLRKGGKAAPRPVELSYTGIHRLKEDTGEIQDAAMKLRDTAIHVNGTYRIAEAGAKDAVLDLRINGKNLPVDDLQMLMAASAVRLPNGSLLRAERSRWPYPSPDVKTRLSSPVRSASKTRAWSVST